MRLIDADALAKVKFHGYPEIEITPSDVNAEAYKRGWNDAIDAIIESTPSIDAVPVKHGRWKIKTINTFEMAYGNTGYEPVYECSVCGRVEESYLRLDEPIMPEDADFPKFCPHCGAKMGEEE